MSAEKPAPAATAPNESEPKGFKPTLTVADMAVYGLVFMVPISPFTIYGNVFFISNGMPALAYLIALVAMLLTALSFGAMIPRFRSAGSVYTYATKALGPAAGFVTGWLMLLQYIITPDLMYIMAAEAISRYVPGVPMWVWCVAMLAIVSLVAWSGIKTTVAVDRAALAMELVVVALFLVFGVRYVLAHPATASFSATAVVDAPKLEPSALLSAMSLCALSYTGYGSIATLTEESKAGPKGPGRAMFLAVLAVGVMFFALCFVATCVDPTGAAMKSDPDNGFYTLAALVGGEWFGVACVVAVALSLGLFSSLAAQTAIARVLYTMGRTGALPSWIGTLSGRDRQPRRAILSVSIFSLVVLVPFLFLDMDLVAKFSNFGAIATYCILDVCVVAARFHSAEKGSIFRELVVPIVGFVFCAVILLSLGTVSLAVGFGWMALGTVYYLVKTRILKRPVSME